MIYGNALTLARQALKREVDVHHDRMDNGKYEAVASRLDAIATLDEIRELIAGLRGARQDA